MGLNLDDFLKVWRYGLYNTVFGRLIGSTGLRSHARKYALNTASAEDTATRILRERRRIYERCNKPLYIESYPQWTLLLPLVPDIFSNYRVAGLVRHPWDYIASMSDHIPGKSRKWRGLQRSQSLNSRFSLKLKPSDVNEPRPERFANEPRWYLAWEWAYWTRALYGFTSQDPKAEFFRYEDLFGRNAQNARNEFLRFIAHEPNRVADEKAQESVFKRITNAAPKSPSRDWSLVDSALRKEIERLCAPLASELGYDF
jgi:hypothetical protein